MKVLKTFTITVTLLLLTSIAPSTAKNDNNDNEWYPFVISAKLDPESPANIGKLVLDAPAGKHGFVKVKDGHFYFEDGTRAKFWGTNLCFNACFPNKKQAEILADRIAFFGFNAVRFAHLDYYFEPNGIFEDIAPTFKDKQLKPTNKLSPSQLDKLDYLIYQLKIRGIYVDFILLCSRFFTEADGIKDAEKLGMAAKPYSLFDKKLIELQKQYAKTLLTHYNPYTKLRYCDDPAIALVEITNENTIFELDNKDIPEYYKKELENLWNDWLKSKEQNTKPTKNKFYLYLEKKYFSEITGFLKNELSIKVPITGSQYSSIAVQESCDFIDKHFYWDHPHFPNVPWDPNNFKIHNKSMLADIKLGIIGNIKNFYSLPNPLNKALSITEWNHCYPNEFAYETPVPLATYATAFDWDVLFQFDFSNGIKKSLSFDDIHNYFAIDSNVQQLILCSLGNLLFDGQKKDLNFSVNKSIFTLGSTYIHGFSGMIKGKTLSFNDGMTFQCNKNSSIFIFSVDGKPIENSKKIVLVTLGGIKNKNSYWMNGKFILGRTPTLLEKIDLTITIPLKRQMRLYKLDEQGNKKDEIKSKKNKNELTFLIKDEKTPWFEINSE